MCKKNIVTHVLTSLAVLLMFCGCADKEETELKEASDAAKEYYTYLKDGNLDEFVKGFSRIDSFPEEYRREFRNNAGQMSEVQKMRYGGLKQVDVGKAVRDTVDNTVDVFLLITYGDSTKNEIVVPMIKNNEKWRMK